MHKKIFPMNHFDTHQAIIKEMTGRKFRETSILNPLILECCQRISGWFARNSEHCTEATLRVHVLLLTLQLRG